MRPPRIMSPEVTSPAIRRADPADRDAVWELLVSAGLPLDGADEAFANGVVAVANGAVVGAAAVELYGTDGLLRSVVVDANRRGTGIGGSLVAAAESMATSLGIRTLYLITETAVAWFPRLGYVAIERSEAPPGIAGSVEFTVACAERGVLMRRGLTPG